MSVPQPHLASYSYCLYRVSVAVLPPSIGKSCLIKDLVGSGGARTAAEAAEGVRTACVRDREAEPMRGTAPTLPAATRQIQNVLVLSCLVLSCRVLK